MAHGIDAARTGMIQHERNIEVIANNIANMNTTGYKRLAVHFQDLLSTEQALDVLFEDGDISPSAGVALDSMTRIFEPGSLVPTGDPLMMAVSGDGLFQVRIDAETIGYTRDGTFAMGADGFIVSLDGYQLEPPIQIPAGASEVLVSTTGVVTVRSDEDGTRTEVGVVQLAAFSDPGQLESIGQNLFVPTEGSGEPLLLVLDGDTESAIFSGMVEASNVDLTTEMTNLIAAQRAYQFNLVAFQTADDMLRQLNDAMQ